MTKVLIDKYPLGSIPGQKTPGRYMDDMLKSNIDILAETIVKDLQFLSICSSSTYEVRSGKSTFMQQIGEYYTDAVNRMHGLNLTFDMKNIVFNSKDLMKTAFELPKYSCLIMDENDEVDEHYFSKLAKDLRRFFRKSGQLNLFIIIIVPNFFQLKSHYAVTRSNFLIDVKFQGKFERGYFSLYNYNSKRELYNRGKKTMDFSVVTPDISGRFANGYAVDREEYIKAKRIDLAKSEEEDNIPDEKEIRKRLFVELRDKLKDKLTHSELCNAFCISDRTGYNYLVEYSQKTTPPIVYETAKPQSYYNILEDNKLINQPVLPISNYQNEPRETNTLS